MEELLAPGRAKSTRDGRGRPPGVGNPKSLVFVSPDMLGSRGARGTCAVPGGLPPGLATLTESPEGGVKLASPCASEESLSRPVSRPASASFVGCEPAAADCTSVWVSLSPVFRLPVSSDWLVRPSDTRSTRPLVLLSGGDSPGSGVLSLWSASGSEDSGLVVRPREASGRAGVCQPYFVVLTWFIFVQN